MRQNPEFHYSILVHPNVGLTEGQDVVSFKSTCLIVALFAGVILGVDTVGSSDGFELVRWVSNVFDLSKLLRPNKD